MLSGDLDDYILDSDYTAVSDGTIEENFEEAFGSPSLVPDAAGEFKKLDVDYEDDFLDVAKYGIVDVVGDDAYGRKVIVVSACRIPNNKVLDQNRFLRLIDCCVYINQD